MPNVSDLRKQGGVLQEWQRYTLTRLNVNGQDLDVDAVHEVMVKAIAEYRPTVTELAVQPGAGTSVLLGELGPNPWERLALKDHPNDGNQSQWSNDWWLAYVKRPNPAGGVVPASASGEYFHVNGQNGYVLTSAAGALENETYGNLLRDFYANQAGDELAQATALVSDLITLKKAPAADLDGNSTKKRAARQIAAALYLAEARRNHLTLLVNLAMLDLLKTGLFTVGEFLSKDLHPMARGGPMADIGNGTAGALSGGNPGTRTRILESSIIMYWLKLVEPGIKLYKDGLEVDYGHVSGGIALGQVRGALPTLDHPVLAALQQRDALLLGLKERVLKTLLTSNKLAYFQL